MSDTASAVSAQFPPMPADPWEVSRHEEGRRRRRLLDGGWKQDLQKIILQRVGTTRADAWGEVILESNAYASITRELSVLYSEPPGVRHDQGSESTQGLSQALRLSGLWGLMARVQQYAVGLREMLVRVHVSAEGRPSYRPVYPDMVVAQARPDAPDQPVAIRELRLRNHPVTGSPIWTLDVLDVSDETNPAYRIVKCESGWEEGEDLTAAYLGVPTMSGEAYPYRRADGRPVLPYVLYHAERLGDRLWDSWRWTELVDATLNTAVKLNLLDHTFAQASWPQRWTLGCQPAGLAASPGGKRAEVVVDPAMLLILEPMEGFNGQPQVGQWSPGGDVEVMERTISSIVARISQEAGVSASDIQRLNSQRSGVSISLTNEGKRNQQRRFAAQFRDPDERLVGLTATLINRATGSSLPEWGYTVAYHELPLSPDELKARREHILALLAEGLVSPVQAYQELNPGVSPEQARQDLAMIARERAMVRGV